MRLFGLILFSLISGSLLAYQDAPKPSDSPLIGHQAFAFSWTDTNGQRVSLSSLRDKTVLLDFWATWCPPCREQFPILAAIAKKFSDKPFIVLGVNALDAPETVRQFLQLHNVGYRTLLTFDDASALEKYGVFSLPFTVLVDRDGVIADGGSYPSKELESVLISKLGNLLRDDYVSASSTKPEAADQLRGVVEPSPILKHSAPPTGPQDLFLKATLEVRMNRMDDALRLTNACLDQSPGWIPALRLRARIYAAQGKSNEALADYTKILSQSPNQADVYGLRADLSRKAGRLDQAREDYEHQTRLDPFNTQAWINLAGADLLENRPDQARKAVDRAIDLSPDSVPAYILRARIEQLLADWNGELADNDRILTLEPNNTWAKTFRPDVELRIEQSSTSLGRDDAYTVYSTILLHPVWDHADDSAVLLIVKVRAQHMVRMILAIA